MKSQNNLSRRKVLALGGMAAIPLLVPDLCAAAQSLNIGTKTLTTLSDGNLVLPVSFLFPDVPAKKISKFLAENKMNPERLEPPCNLTLLRDGKRTILFDAGAGPNFMPSAGKLPETLEAAGVAPETITDVIFTHGHPDHLWGIVDDFDEIAFPQAKLHFPRTEWDFWRADDTLSKMSEARQTFAIGAKNRLDAMEAQVVLFDAGQEVVSGVEAVATPGHTPGHTAFVIHGNGAGDPVMVVGDALTNHIVSFQRPDWPSGSDQDAEMGAKTRKSLLDRLAGEKMTIVGFHLPNNGLGRVERNGNAYRFAPG